MNEVPPTSDQGGAPPPVQPAVPAGWYPHPTAPGWEAYWTGAGWGTETRAAQQAPPVAPAAPAAAQVAEPQPVEAQQPPTPAPAAEPAAASVLPAAAAPAAAATAVADSGSSDSSLPVILCFLGAVVAIVGCFLPAATSDIYTDIADNTMVAAGYGIAVIVAGVLGAVIAAYFYVKGNRTWLPILLGVVIIGIAVYAGTAGLDITPNDASLSPGAAKALAAAADDGSPSTGIFAVGAGGILMVLGGIGLARRREQPVQPAA